MGIVIELQKQAIDTDSDVVSLLRKAYLVARKLDIKDFEEWINSELNGYTDYDKIPDYREIRGQVKAWNPYHGWIPVIIQEREYEDVLSTRKVFDSIPSLYNAICNIESQTLTYSFDGSTLAALCRMTHHNTNYQLHFSKSAIVDIIEQVKNKILDWALLLEENGIVGENLQFSVEEKETVKNVPQITNYVNNFFGDVKDSQIQEGSKDSSQIMGQ